MYVPGVHIHIYTHTYIILFFFCGKNLKVGAQSGEKGRGSGIVCKIKNNFLFLFFFRDVTIQKLPHLRYDNDNLEEKFTKKRNM